MAVSVCRYFLVPCPKTWNNLEQIAKIACSDASAALRSASAEVCVYTSAVVLRLECPSNF